MTDRRRELLRIMAQTEQLMAEAESVLAGEIDDKVLLHTSVLLREHRRMLMDVESKLREEETHR